jgi:hypothetical protein
MEHENERFSIKARLPWLQPFAAAVGTPLSLVHHFGRRSRTGCGTA